MLNEFVEGLVIHEGERRSANRPRPVDIFSNFIGLFEITAEIVRPMEVLGT
ncbi:MAG: DUF4368 domain-containing protein [Deltaproteobacteria bacterium]|jgi:hypothetical protein|nr:DUF4368 domain-containing protein [Deltaproteobacteria bacterium]